MRRLGTLAIALLLAGPAQAGILLEGRLEGVPIRLELAGPGEPGEARVRATVAGEGRWVDLEQGTVEPAGPASAGVEPPATGLVRLTPLGGGAMIAGHGGSWQILTEDGRVCGEVLAAGWMLRFLEPAVRAVELLQAGDPRLRPRPRHGCSPLGFRHWTSQGWPLLAGGRAEAVFVTERIRFDHARDPAEGRPPPAPRRADPRARRASGSGRAWPCGPRPSRRARSPADRG